MTTEFTGTPSLDVSRLVLDVYQVGDKPATDSPVTTWTGDELVESFTTTQALGREIGQGEILLQGRLDDLDQNGSLVAPFTAPFNVQQTTATESIRHGHLITVDAAHERTSGLERQGWLRIADHEYQTLPGDIPVELRIEYENWLFGLLDSRRFTGRIREQPLNQAIQRILTAEVPEVSLSFNIAAPPTVTATFDAERCRTAIASLVGDSGLLVADEDTLKIEPLPSSTTGTLTDEDLQLPNRRVTDDGLTTHLRVDGGTLGVRAPEAIAPAVDTYVEPANTQVRVQLDSAFSELDSIELQTRHSNADGTLVARLQADDGGQPIAPGDVSRDLATTRLSSEFVSPDGTTRFEFAEHDIPTPGPWLIVDQQTSATNPSLYEVGGTTVGGTFRPARTDVQARRQVLVLVRNTATADRYGRRDERIRDESLASREEAEAVGNEALSRRDSPSEELSAGAFSTDAYDVGVLDAQDVTVDQLAIDDAYVVFDIEDEISETKLSRTLILRQPAGFSP